MKIAIVIPCFNNFAGLADMLASVRTKHDWQPYVIDNWRINRGCSKGWNEGFARAKADGADLILICNDDILFAKHTIDALVEEFEQQPGEVIMMTAVNVAGSCPTPETIFDFARQESNLAEHPDFSCFMVRPDFQEKIGTFDENIWPAYFEDNDTHRRIILSGYKALCTSGAAYYHHGSKTIQNLPADNVVNENFARNEAYFTQKWGGGPGHEQYDHPFNDPNNKVNEWRRI